MSDLNPYSLTVLTAWIQGKVDLYVPFTVGLFDTMLICSFFKPTDQLPEEFNSDGYNLNSHCLLSTDQGLSQDPSCLSFQQAVS